MMGREIRRTPVGYEPPVLDNYQGQTNLWDWTGQNRHFQPQYDEDYETALQRWWDDREAWKRGEDPDRIAVTYPGNTYEEWYGNAPDPSYYRPAWPDDAVLGFQFYETISEGTPLSPSFASREELAEFLAPRHFGGDREAAARFVDVGWAPSMAATGGRWISGTDWVASTEEEADEHEPKAAPVGGPLPGAPGGQP